LSKAISFLAEREGKGFEKRSPNGIGLERSRLMPATPAWPPASLPRLYVEQTLSEGAAVHLDGAPANYLANVLRLRPGAQVKLFDDRTGEWLAEIAAAGRRRVVLNVVRHLRPREPVPDLWLLFAPIKRGRIDWLVEKATELGVDRLVPVLTARTVVDRLNLDRLRAHVIEAAEQCDRTALPELAAPERLAAVLDRWPPRRSLYFADEGGGAPLGAVAAPAPAAYRPGAAGVARSAHPARRHGGRGRRRFVDGGGGRLEGRASGTLS
jgi:16S rRNA (uracil1498-N3)-methyltransferase